MTPWLRSLNAGTLSAPAWRVYLCVSGITLLTWIISRLTVSLELKIQVKRILLGLCLILVLWVGFRWLHEPMRTLPDPAFESTSFPSLFSEALSIIPSWFWVSLATIGLWWRGIWLSKEHLGPMTVFGQVRMGVVMFVLFAMSGFFSPFARQVNPYPFVFLFILNALFTLVLSRVYTMGFLRGGQRNPFDGRWFGAIFITTGLFVCVAYACSLVVTGQSEILIQLLAGLFYFVGSILAAPLLFLLYLIGPEVDAIRESFPTITPLPAELEIASESGAAGRLTGVDPGISLSPEAQLALIVVGMVALVIFLLWTLRYTLSQKNESDEEDADEGDIEGNLLDLIERVFRQRLQSMAAKFEARNLLSDHERKKAAERIRQIYVEFLDLTTDAGLPRLSFETPVEYTGRISELYSTITPDLQLMTSGYLKIRYGGLPEKREEVGEIENAFAHIKDQFKTIRNKNPEKNIPVTS